MSETCFTLRWHKGVSTRGRWKRYRAGTTDSRGRAPRPGDICSRFASRFLQTRRCRSSTKRDPRARDETRRGRGWLMITGDPARNRLFIERARRRGAARIFTSRVALKHVTWPFDNKFPSSPGPVYLVRPAYLVHARRPPARCNWLFAGTYLYCGMRSKRFKGSASSALALLSLFSHITNDRICKILRLPTIIQYHYKSYTYIYI